MVKTQGRHGEVAVELHTGAPERFREGARLFALALDGTRREVRVEESWPHKTWLVLKFAGIDSMSDAETLRRTELQVPVAERAALDAGWTYISDLTGCKVLDDDREIGVIAEVRFGAGEAPLLMVTADQGKIYEIPYAEAYLVKLDLAAKQVHMRLPEGMLEINSPLSGSVKRKQNKGGE